MQQRGRKTEGALSAEESTEKPEPLSHLTDEQKEIWRRIVEALPADWFRDETLDLLADYCGQVAMQRKVDRRATDLPDDASLDELGRLILWKEKISKMLVSLSTKMRITQQATFDKSKRKNAEPPDDDPW